MINIESINEKEADDLDRMRFDKGENSEMSLTKLDQLYRYREMVLSEKWSIPFQKNHRGLSIKYGRENYKFTTLSAFGIGSIIMMIIWIILGRNNIIGLWFVMLLVVSITVMIFDHINYKRLVRDIDCEIWKIKKFSHET